METKIITRINGPWETVNMSNIIVMADAGQVRCLDNRSQNLSISLTTDYDDWWTVTTKD